MPFHLLNHCFLFFLHFTPFCSLIQNDTIFLYTNTGRLLQFSDVIPTFNKLNCLCHDALFHGLKSVFDSLPAAGMSTFISRTVIVILMINSAAVDGKTCGIGQYLNKRGKCRDCEICQPGKGMNFSMEVKVLEILHANNTALS